MARYALIVLPPSRMDLAVARACARSASRRRERSVQVLTWLADEKVLVGATALFWLYAHGRARDPALAPQADRMLLSVGIAGALPHLFKYLVRRRRPDRTVVRKGRRHGVPLSGNAWDSFPSGHAVHMGAIAGPITSLAPGWLRPLVWPLAAALAGTRTLLLAHYPSDVGAGLALGFLIDRAVGALSRRARRQALRSSLTIRAGRASRCIWS